MMVTRLSPPKTDIGPLTAFRPGEIHDLCDAAEAAILDGGGFGWVTPPSRDVLEAYWNGVLAIRERQLFVGRLDGVIAGSAQLLRPARNAESQRFAAQLTTSFVAPWARGHGLARGLTSAVEDAAREEGFRTLLLDVRETQEAAIHLYQTYGYVQWGRNPRYAEVNGKMVAGVYFYKDLAEEAPGGSPSGKGAGR